MVEIFKGFILFLFVDGTPLEFTPKDNLSECPYCPKGVSNSKGNDNKTQVAGTPSQKTVDAGSGGDLNKTQIFGGGGSEPTELKTEVFGAGKSGGSVGKRDLNKTYIQGVTDEDDGENSKGSTPRATRKIMGWIISYDLDPMGIDYRIYEGRNILGSSTSCDITIVGDNSVSGTHCVILCRKNKFEISDEMSSNGTFLNNEELDSRQPTKLNDGDEIKLGEKTMFKFKTPI